jgi:hypothetical protein
VSDFQIGRLRQIGGLSEGSIQEAAQLLRRLEQPAERMTEFWRRLAAIRIFNELVFAEVIVPGLVPGQTLTFERIASHSRIEPVPRVSGTYRVRDAARVELLYDWKKADPSMSGVREFHERLLRFYDEHGAPDDVDRLISEIVAAPQKASAHFDALFEAADRAFDLPRCHLLLQALRNCDVFVAGGREVSLRLLNDHLRARCSDLTSYLELRGRYMEDYYQTSSYLHRKSLFALF